MQDPLSVHRLSWQYPYKFTSHAIKAIKENGSNQLDLEPAAQTMISHKKSYSYIQHARIFKLFFFFCLHLRISDKRVMEKISLTTKKFLMFRHANVIWIMFVSSTHHYFTYALHPEDEKISSDNIVLKIIFCCASEIIIWIFEAHYSIKLSMYNTLHMHVEHSIVLQVRVIVMLFINERNKLAHRWNISLIINIYNWWPTVKALHREYGTYTKIMIHFQSRLVFFFNSFFIQH